VDDLQKSLAFFEGLGFGIEERWEEDGVLLGVMLRAGDTSLNLSQDDWKKGRGRQKGLGKLRARQTAEVLRRACNPLAEFAVIRGLRPEDPPGEIKARLTGERRDVMLVGHMPGLPRLLHDLLSLSEGAPAPSFRQHGLVALEAVDDGWVEPAWRHFATLGTALLASLGIPFCAKGPALLQADF
jgi:hypothetical protein